MQQDAQGLAVSTASEAAARAFDHVIAGYLGYRADTPVRLAALLEADPDFPLAHCLKGYLTMLQFKQAAWPAAADCAATAQALGRHATPRERAHMAALQAWSGDAIDRAIGIWEGILAEHPHDVLAFRLAHFNNFWLGRPGAMAASAERVVPRWSAALPGYGSVLGCHCFALEECGEYAAAEPAGRWAVELDPGDMWATHAVAHIMEMQGRRREGIAWLGALAANWEGGNNLQHHLWWHCALYHLEHGDTAAVLGLYDRRFRNLASPLVQAQPDVYIDVQNACSMLFRLQRLGVEVGDRWDELADKAEARIGDCASAFTLPHWMMALAATGRAEAARRMLGAMREFANGTGTIACLVRECALPVAEAVWAHGQGRFAEAVETMRPALGGMYRLGGSHAQQDVLEQLFLDSALRAGLEDDVRLALERQAGRQALPPERWVGWRGAAQRYPL